jgi:hypothetical protein
MRLKIEGDVPLWSKVFFALVIVGVVAAAYGAIKTYVDQSKEGTDLRERGVETDADVMSVTESDGYSELSVSYDPPGPPILEFAEVQDCSGARYEKGVETVRVVYLPDDPEVIRMNACRASFDSDKLPGFVGIALIAFALFMLWRLRGMWAS